MTRTIRVPGETDGEADAFGVAVALAAGELLAAGEGEAFFLAAPAVDVRARIRTTSQETPEANGVRFIELVSALCGLGWLI